jgi:hypothetical protein
MQLSRYKTHARRGQDGTPERLTRRGRRRAALLGVATAAVVAAPVALAAGTSTHHFAHAATLADNTPLKGAIHNPASGAYLRTTGIFANFSSWTTRIQNVGSGGAGTFGCKASSSGSACLASENNNGGLAFTFASTGSTGGKILLTNPNAAPFTTNAHGQASGLNANYLQGKEAKEFQLAKEPAANANELGGKPASEYLTTGQLLFADVSSEAKIVSTRGATAVTPSGQTFTITFGTANLSKCSLTASPTGAALTTGQLGVEVSTSNASQAIVSAPSGFTGGFDLQVLC